MKNTIITLAAAGTFLSSASAQNLLINGSFEDDGFFTGTPSGWTSTSGNVDGRDSSFPLIADGTYGVDLDGTSPIVELSQSFSTIIGGSYTFSFASLGSVGVGEGMSYDITGINNVLSGTYIDTTNAITYFTTTFIADSTTSTLSISSLNLNGINNAGMLIDDVSITTLAVPEPSSTALIGLGMLGFIMRRRR